MKNFVLAAVCIFAFFGLQAQSSLSFYHLGNTTFQGRYYNPAFVPEGKLFIGLPVLSGIHVSYNNKFSYSDLIVKGESKNSYDLRRFLSSLQKNNMVSMSTSIGLFHLALTPPDTDLHFALFANEKVDVDFLYPKSLMQFVIEGNGSLVGERLKIGKTRLLSSYYREYGAGVTKVFDAYGLSIGANVKYLQGFVNASTPGNFTAYLTTDAENYALDLDMENAALRTAGLDIANGQSGDMGAHLVSNGNRGVALDVGFSARINDRYSLAASLVDLGFISWKDDIKNHHVGDTSMYYSGIDLKDIIKGERSLEQTFKDSLINKFKYKKTENADPYTTMMPLKVYMSGVYHLPGNGDILGTFGGRFIQDQMKVLIGAGYRRSFGRMLTATVNVTRLPQQFLNLGAAIAVKGGPAQMYVAVDQVVNFDATRFRAVDVRFGINLLFNERNTEIKTTGVKGGQTTRSSFLGNKVRVKRKEGIYNIIQKQKRRKESEYIKRPD